MTGTQKQKVKVGQKGIFGCSAKEKKRVAKER